MSTRARLTEYVCQPRYRGKVDVLVAGWLPWSHGVNHKPACRQGSPEYCSVRAVRYLGGSRLCSGTGGSIEDLLHAPALGRMDRLIQGMARSGYSGMSPKAMQACGLKEAGYHFENGTEDVASGV